MKQPFVVAVTGGRGYYDMGHISRSLDAVYEERTVDVLVHGGCSGADAGAKAWAVARLVQTAEFRVTASQWHESKSAGPIRNRLMLTVCKPDLLVAFPGGDGTDGCVEIGRELGIEIRDERSI